MGFLIVVCHTGPNTVPVTKEMISRKVLSVGVMDPPAPTTILKLDSESFSQNILRKTTGFTQLEKEKKKKAHFFSYQLIDSKAKLISLASLH